MADNFSNAAETLLNGAINDSVTSITIDSATGFPAEVPFRIRIVAEGANTNEICTVTAGAGTTTWTVERASEAYGGVQTASAHADNATVEHVLTAGALRSMFSGQAFVGARVYNDANISTTNDVGLAVTFNSERFDSDGFHDTGSNTSRFTIPAGMGGKYLIIGQIEWAANATGFRNVYLRVDGSTVIAVTQIEEADSASASPRQIVSTIYHLDAGQYVELIAHQNSTGSLNVLSTANFSPEFMLVKLDSGKLGQGIGVRLNKSGSNQSLATATATAITFDNELFDTDGFHSTSSNTERITIPAGLGGVYLIGATLSFATNATGRRHTSFRLNGTTSITDNIVTAVSTQPTRTIAQTSYRLNAGEYVEVMGFQDSGGNLNVDASYATAFWAMRLDSGGNGYTAEKWGKGSAFPTGAVTGDRWTRTDRNIDYFYDGTRWLSVHLYRENFDAANGLSTTPVAFSRWTPWHTTYDLYLEKLYASTYVSGTNNGTNYWTVDFTKYDVSNNPTVVVSFNTSGDTVANWVTREVNIGALLTPATYKQTQINAAMTLTPGSFYGGFAVSYRLVG